VGVGRDRKVGEVTISSALGSKNRERRVQKMVVSKIVKGNNDEGR